MKHGLINGVHTRLPSHRIDVQGLEFGYGNGRVFEDFSFVSDARVTMLRGPSGCGKTTLLKLLYGLLEPQQTRGWEVPGPAFLVLQADTLVPWFTGRQNVERFSRELWDQVRHGPFYDLLAPFIERRAHEMSYGQRRSIEMARALSSGAPLLLFDEPFNFLDPDKRRFFLTYLDSQHGTPLGSRVVLTTHYVEEVPIRGADCFEFRGEMPHRRIVPCEAKAG